MTTVEMLTAKDMQALLQVDRSTILPDGRGQTGAGG